MVAGVHGTDICTPRHYLAPCIKPPAQARARGGCRSQSLSPPSSAATAISAVARATTARTPATIVNKGHLAVSLCRVEPSAATAQRNSLNARGYGRDAGETGFKLAIKTEGQSAQSEFLLSRKRGRGLGGSRLRACERACEGHDSITLPHTYVFRSYCYALCAGLIQY